MFCCFFVSSHVLICSGFVVVVVVVVVVVYAPFCFLNTHVWYFAKFVIIFIVIIVYLFVLYMFFDFVQQCIVLFLFWNTSDNSRGARCPRRQGNFFPLTSHTGGVSFMLALDPEVARRPWPRCLETAT